MFLFDSFGFNLFTSFIIALTTLYFYLSRNFNYWKNRGVKGPKPIVGFGTIYQLFFKDLHSINLNNVTKYGKVYGAFMGEHPILLIADPKLIKDIAIKDFHLFADRNELITGDIMNDRAISNVFGDDWKFMRSILSPAFSSGKMRKMHPIIAECVQRLDYNLKQCLKNCNEVEIKKLMTCLTIDVITCCAFGTKTDPYSQNSNDFAVNIQKFLKGTWRIWVFFPLAFLSPKLIKWTKFQLVEPSVTSLMKSMIHSITSRRETEDNKPLDLIQIMINAQHKTHHNDKQDSYDSNTEELFENSDETQNYKNTTNKTQMCEDDILANSFFFFAAGVAPTAVMLSHLFYSLAMNEDYQQKLCDELQKYGPNPSWEQISRMPYLEACVAETLRLYNPISMVSRMAAQDYKLGDTGITIPKGMIVNFDIHSVHHSSEYFEEPDKFNPDRFIPENKVKLTPYSYMPFGIGPRNCIGITLAVMEVKTAAAFLINKYRFFKTAKTQKKFKPKKFEFILTVGDIHIGMELRNKSVATHEL